MIKLILIGVAVWLLFTIIKGYQRNVGQTANKPERPEDMVKCARCGVHLPKSESVQREGQFYCAEHEINNQNS